MDLSTLSDQELLSLRDRASDAPVKITVNPSSKSRPLSEWSDAELLAARQSKVGYGEDIAKSGGIGLVKGAIGLAGLPSDVAEYGARGIDAATRGVNAAVRYMGGSGFDAPKRAPVDSPAFGGADLRQRLESVTGPLYEPKTVPGHYAQTTGEFAAGALVGPGGVASRVAQTVIPAFTSETAGRIPGIQGTAAEPYARFGGALAGGIGTTLATRPGATARAVRGQLPEGVTPQMVDRAEALIADAQRMGVTLSWPEALSQVAGRPVLSNLMRHLEASPQTEGRMGEFFAGRVPQNERYAAHQIGNIAPRNNAPSTIGPAVGEAAEGTINAERQNINRVAEPFYNRAGLDRVDAATMGRIRMSSGWAEARDAVRNDRHLDRYIAHLPENSVGFLNEVKKHLGQAAENASSPVNAQRSVQRSAGYRMDEADVRRAGIDASPAYETALAIQTQGREQFLQPLLNGPLGKLAGSDTATQKAINVLFPKQPLASSAQEVGEAVTALVANNPRAARDLVRAHVEKTFNEASKDLQTGQNQAGGAKFRAVLVGNQQQAANLEAAVRALPHGNQVWPGFERFLEVMEAQGTRQNVGSRTAYNTEFNKNASTSGVAIEGAKAVANPLRGFQFLADRYERWKLGSDLNGLAAILTDPAAAGRLRAIAHMPINSVQARNLAVRLATMEAGSRDTTPLKITVNPVDQPRQ